MGSPSVSVVIPVYNRAALVSAAVQSALEQSHRPLEILVVDDGSTDRTPEVCAALPEPARYLRQENAGAAAARNHGLREARGELVAFLDSDDVWEPQKLAVHAAAHGRWPEAGWVISDSLIVDDDLKPHPGPQGFERGFPLFHEFGVSAPSFFADSLERGLVEVEKARYDAFHGDAFGLLLHGNFVQPSALTVRRELLEAVGGFDESVALVEDNDLALRLAAREPLVVILASLVRWRVGSHDSVIKPQNTERLVRGALACLERAAGLRPLSDEERRAYERGREALWLRLAYDQLSRLDGRAARASLSEAFALGMARSPRALALLTAAFLPASALRALHWAKRRL